MTPDELYAYNEALRRIREEETGALDLSLSELPTLNRLPAELERLTSLQSLDLSGCSRLSGDLSPLASLTSLRYLNLTGCSQLSDLSPFARLTSLQSLNLALCEKLSGDLSPLAKLTSLQSLNLYGCEGLSGNLSPLAALTSLWSLNLGGCARLRGDLSPLTGLTSLQSLSIRWCHNLRGDLSPLAGLASLQSLYLTGCSQLSDLSPLVGLTSLQSLDLFCCLGVRRFAQLESLLPTLKELYLRGCKLDDLPTEVCGESFEENVLDKVRAHYHALRQIFVSYAWGDTSPNSEEDSQRQEVVEQLCQTLEKENRNVIRDKNALHPGDLISNFMMGLGQARLVIVVLSDKYLRSPYCMTELYSIYQNARQERQEFLNRIIPLALKDANIGTWRGRASYAEHWEAEFKAMEQHFTRLGEEDLKLYRAMRRWHNEVGDMLAYVNDVLTPHGFDEIVKDDFAGLRRMLERRR